jgi:hypothetical protein
MQPICTMVATQYESLERKRSWSGSSGVLGGMRERSSSLASALCLVPGKSLTLLRDGVVAARPRSGQRRNLRPRALGARGGGVCHDRRH